MLNQNQYKEPESEKINEENASSARLFYSNYNASSSGLYPPYDFDLEEEFDAVRSIN
ncbi:hypothetical protein [Legionella oakridgensis]|uniref:Uncharacterized protein n=2 Tax=Legionella oakridgensis TaxID=29423 RepID=W0BEY3_9GAMM|nr:hypothetical protein [Legionella oakridgensis]AHE66984.1 hypothetical protein Loa_01431 [Legionella oakridgensis ATCC 33761 = DSM 21215]ETO93345.1 hypothetical protein LOR_45c07480 [Legionella oakridgensis RV-2-2007]KTD38360.1 hypothetical protein Loak_1305 [Legionella oakridgensis]STY20086.1 Uncharacterised protein [Legionella longbeachae]